MALYENNSCPVCGKQFQPGDDIVTCPECGSYLVRLKFRKHEDNTWSANRLVYEADDSMVDFYRSKAALSRRRGRGHSKKKNRPASKQ